MKVAIYCRVSRADLNPENQKRDLVEYANKMGYDYEVFEEIESTRKTRPIKNRIFQEALQKKWDLILVWKLDRWARSLSELIMDLERLKDRKVDFQSYNENLELSKESTASAMFQAHIFGAFSQFERDLIRERTMAGLARAKAQGKTLGRPRKAIKKQGRVYVLEGDTSQPHV